MPDSAQDILTPLNIPQSVKADAWDAYHAAPDHNALTPMLLGVKGLPQSAKADLWDAKFNEANASRVASMGQAVKPVSTSTLGAVGRELTTPALQIKPGPAPLAGLVEREIAQGNPIRARLASFASGSAEDALHMLSALTSPLNVGLMAAGGGEGVIPRAVSTAGAAGYGALGAKQALTGTQPGESPADALQRRLLGASMAVGGAAGVGAQGQASLGKFLGKHFGLSPELANKVADQVSEIQQSKGAIGQKEASTAETGRQVISNAAQAVYQEHARVSKPFEDIAEQMKGPVSDSATVRGIVNKAFTDAGASTDEIPGAALRAIPSTGLEQASVFGGQAGAGQVGGRDVASALGQSSAQQRFWETLTPEERKSFTSATTPSQSAGVSFRDLTRIREDVGNAAMSAKDTTVKRALLDAHDQITNLQEQAADKAGLGKQYASAKRDYMNFKRGAGSGMMNDLLSAADVEDQAMGPKIAALTTRGNAEAIRTVLKPLGVDVGPLDKMLEETETARTDLKNVLSEQKGTIVPGKGAEVLQGMTNEQVNSARLSALMRNARGSGVANPSGLVMTVYGLMRMAMGSPFGAMPFLYGVARTSIPDMVKSPAFQDYVLKQSGITPNGANRLKVNRAMRALVPFLQSAASGRKNP